LTVVVPPLLEAQATSAAAAAVVNATEVMLAKE
jgi:hypothetical protein